MWILLFIFVNFLIVKKKMVINKVKVTVAEKHWLDI